jgi:hypothetical protein
MVITIKKILFNMYTLLKYAFEGWAIHLIWKMAESPKDFFTRSWPLARDQPVDPNCDTRMGVSRPQRSCHQLGKIYIYLYKMSFLDFHHSGNLVAESNSYEQPGKLSTMHIYFICTYPSLSNRNVY